MRCGGPLAIPPGSAREVAHPRVIYGGDLVCCLDPRAIKGATDADLVAIMPDTSGRGNDFTAAGSVRPVYLSAGIGGNPSLVLQGDQYLTGPSALIPGNGICTVGIVFQTLVRSTTAVVLAQYAAGQTGRTLFNANQNSAGTTSAGQLNPFLAAASAGAGTGAFPADVRLADISTVILNNTGAAEGATVQLGGAVWDTFTCTTVYTGVATAIGGYSGMGAGTGLCGCLGPFVIVNRASTAKELVKLQAWLRTYARA